jgi:hypothetical protein
VLHSTTASPVGVLEPAIGDRESSIDGPDPPAGDVEPLRGEAVGGAVEGACPPRKPDAWRSEFPGRNILKLFVTRRVQGASYEVFRNIILDKMAERGVEPHGMKAVLDQIEGS